MRNKNGTNFEDFKAELLEDQNVRREYEALKPKYDIIRRFIERRNQLGINQAQLAEIVGMQQPAISRLENGDHNTTLGTFIKVANALDLDISLKVRSRATKATKRVTV